METRPEASRTADSQKPDTRLRRSTKIIILVVAVLFGVPLLFVLVDLHTSSKVLDRARAQARAKGYPLTDRELDLRVPADNGADKVRAVCSAMKLGLDAEVFDIVTDQTFNRWTMDLYRTDPDKVVAATAKAEPFVEQLRKALASKSFAYTTGPVRDDAMKPHLRVVRQMGRMLYIDAVVRVERGRPDKAVDDIDTMLRLSESLDGEPRVFDGLYALIIDTLVFDVSRRLVDDPAVSAAMLRRASSLLARRGSSLGFRPHLEGELVMWNNVDWMSGITRMGGLSIGSPKPRYKRFIYEHYGPLQVRDQAMTIRILTRMLDTADEPVLHDTAGLKRHYLRDVTGYRFMAYRLSRMTEHLQTFVQYRAAFKASAIALHLAADLREGKTPDLSLKQFPEDLRTDPFGGKPLKAVLHPDRLLVYSIGENLTDDGATPEDFNDYRQGLPHDWVFRVKLQPSKKP